MKVVNGMYFSESTNDKVCNILSTSKERLRFYYGDIKTGKCWMEEYDTIGYVGKSSGSVKVPLLIKNSTSTVYNEMGISENLFNTDGNLSLEKSILTDESVMRNLLL